MKIVFTAITGMRNRGVEALVRTAIEQLALVYPNARFRVITDTPDYDRKVFEDRSDVEFFPAHRQELLILHQGLKRQLRILVSKFHEPVAAPIYRDYLAHMRWADLVIASSGDGFSSDYGHTTLRALLMELKMAFKFEKPVVFLAHSIGPFKNREQANEWLDVANKAALITVRESLTHKYLCDELGMPEKNVIQTADTAFLLRPSPPDQIEVIRNYYQLTKDKPTVALSLSNGICRYSRSSEKTHLQRMASLCELITQEFDANILLIPHVQENYANNDDRNACFELVKMMGYPSSIHVAAGSHGAADYKGLIGSCDMVIAERMHAAIAGLSSAVCTLPVQYSIKAPGILKYVINDEAIAKQLILPFTELLESPQVDDQIRQVWTRRHDIAAHLASQMPRVRADATRNFELVRHLSLG